MPNIHDLIKEHGSLDAAALAIATATTPMVKDTDVRSYDAGFNALILLKAANPHATSADPKQPTE